MAFGDHLRTGLTDANPLFVATRDTRDAEGFGDKAKAFVGAPVKAIKNSLVSTFNKGDSKEGAKEKAMLASGSAQATQEAAVE